MYIIKIENFKIKNYHYIFYNKISNSTLKFYKIYNVIPNFK